MDINDLFDGIMKSISPFAEDRSCAFLRFAAFEHLCS